MKQSDLLSAQTLEAITHIKQLGIHNMTVIMRHSEKRTTQIPGMEAFMPLTESGKAYAASFGEKFPYASFPIMMSSTFGRCIETAYLIQKGFSQNNPLQLPHPVISRVLTPFYVTNIRRVSELAQQMGNDEFISKWFSNQFETDMILDPETTAGTLVHFMKKSLDILSGKEICVCISHDWNLFPIKEFCLGLPFENNPDIGYLEGIILYKDGENYYLSNGKAATAHINFDTLDHIEVPEP